MISWFVADLTHLFCTSLSLSIVGPEVESRFGRMIFLFIYLLSGILANLGTFASSNAPASLGPSGAICGLIGAGTYYYLVNRKRLGEVSEYALRRVKRTILFNAIPAYFGTGSDYDHYAQAYGFIAGIGILAAMFVLREVFPLLEIL